MSMKNMLLEEIKQAQLLYFRKVSLQLFSFHLVLTSWVK